MTKNKRLITAIAIILIVALLSVLALMLYPLYGEYLFASNDIMYTYTIIVDGEEREYRDVVSVESNGLIAALIKGKTSDATDTRGIWNIYTWRLAPSGDTEYLLIEHTEEFAEKLRSEGPHYKNPLIVIKRLKSSNQRSADIRGEK